MAAKVLPITKQVEISRNKEFVTVLLDGNDEIFMVYVVALKEPTIIPIQSFYKVQVTWLTSTKTFLKYSNFSDIFFLDSVIELLKYTRINNYLINLLNAKQPFYNPINSLKLVELETLKIYIKPNLVRNLIKLPKFFANTSILFAQKIDGSFHLYINYLGFYSLTIKNYYLQPLINELLNCLSCDKSFTYLNLTN